jgi:hypothetical protein
VRLGTEGKKRFRPTPVPAVGELDSFYSFVFPFMKWLGRGACVNAKGKHQEES